MREIKIRGYAVERMVKSQWIYGFGVSKCELTNGTSEIILYTDSSPIEVHEESVGQYTGLEDKNGAGIYEGDILRFTNFDTTGGHLGDAEYTGLVKWKNGMFELWSEPESEYFGNNGGFILQYVWLQDDEIEIIGNLYQNPELLKEEAK